ncbi:MAG: helix-turn-helix domain-containing protein [Halothiobacillaceae bacterium]
MNDAQTGREAHAALLLEMSRLINGALPAERRIRIALGLMSHWAGLHFGRIMLPDHREKVLRVAFHHGLPSTELALDRYTVPMSQGLTGHVWRNGQAAVVADILNEPIFLRRIAVPMRGSQHRIGFICVPMKLEAPTIGVLSAQRLPDPQHRYSDDVDLMRIVSSMITPVLQGLHVKAETEHDEAREAWVSYTTLHPRRPRTYRRVQDADVLAIEAALKHASGNQAQAARLLGMTPRQLRYRLKKLGIGRPAGPLDSSSGG